MASAPSVRRHAPRRWCGCCKLAPKRWIRELRDAARTPSSRAAEREAVLGSHGELVDTASRAVAPRAVKSPARRRARSPARNQKPFYVKALREMIRMRVAAEER